jgi:hypothetical protein
MTERTTLENNAGRLHVAPGTTPRRRRPAAYLPAARSDGRAALKHTGALSARLIRIICAARVIPFLFLFLSRP